MRIDWPRERASPGSLGAPKSSSARTTMMTMCHPCRPANMGKLPFVCLQVYVTRVQVAHPLGPPHGTFSGDAAVAPGPEPGELPGVVFGPGGRRGTEERGHPGGRPGIFPAVLLQR